VTALKTIKECVLSRMLGCKKPKTVMVLWERQASVTPQRYKVSRDLSSAAYLADATVQHLQQSLLYCGAITSMPIIYLRQRFDHLHQASGRIVSLKMQAQGTCSLVTRTVLC